MEKKRFVTVAVGCHWLKIANYGGQGHSFNQQAALNIFNHPGAMRFCQPPDGSTSPKYKLLRF